ncbi:serine/threonine protein kinase [Corallococcus sp. M34]|uniref:serine/threonine-protein kinase n=1 Tax=Citreicoccus inhibens TaxID=2849499 RepID=UPI001C212799|nr:serine/threonine-protein kinase [Citreicoccus inhibens]MBU8897009.1 serine/threonine protein kinase [Citreicoccus inhibens]
MSNHRPRHPEETTPLVDAEPELSLYGDELEPGARVGPWIVETRVHPGITAWLYRARHEQTRELAALKVVRSRYTLVSEVLRRFQQEADTLRALIHPHIVEVRESGELSDGRPWLAMEWLDGGSVDAWLAHRGPFSLAEALTVMEELGAALQLAHAQGVLHRDLKAQNVMMVPQPEGFRVKLVDFGIAQVRARGGSRGLTSEGAVLGTPSAMAPEQIRGQAVDARTDQYALGVLLYQLLTGRLPFSGTSAVELEEQHLHAPAPRLGEQVKAPSGVCEATRRAMAKRPEERFPDVSTFLGALRAALGHEPPLSTAPWVAALFVDVRVPEGTEEPSDAAMDARDAAVDHAREALRAAGWTLDAESSNALLARCALPSNAPPTHAEVRAVAERVMGEAMREADTWAEVRLYTDIARGAPRDLEHWATGGRAGTLRIGPGFLSDPT